MQNKWNRGEKFEQGTGFKQRKEENIEYGFPKKNEGAQMRE